jgi:hypothetical protein
MRDDPLVSSLQVQTGDEFFGAGRAAVALVATPRDGSVQQRCDIGEEARLPSCEVARRARRDPEQEAPLAL